MREPIDFELRRRAVSIGEGTYLYVGSSKKPCTVFTRVLRHASKHKKKHWHIDYVTASTSTAVKGALLVASSYGDCEVELARLLADRLPYIPAFGSTDKKQSPSHFFKCTSSYKECLAFLLELLESSGCVENATYLELGSSIDEA